MFRHKFTQTGLPYLIFALLLIGVIIYAENSLSSQNDNTSIIVISSENDDSFEGLTPTETNLAPANEKISTLIEKLLENGDVFSNLEQSSDATSLSELEKTYLYSELARWFYVKHNYKNVIESLGNIKPDNRLRHKVQFLYAYSLSKESNKQLAIEQYQLLINHEPLSQAANLNLGLLLKKLDLCIDAIPVFMTTASISSGNRKAKALSGLASCHYQLEQYDEAITYYKKSIEYRPNASHVWIMLANAIAATDNAYLQALDTFTKGVALNAQDYKSHLSKARFQIAHYDYTGAIDSLKTALSLSNNNETHELIAWAYIEVGKRVNAKKHLMYLSKYSSSKKQKKRAELLFLYADKQYKNLILELKNNKHLSDDMLYLKGLTYRRLYYYSNAFKIFDELADSKDLIWRSQIQQARMTRSRKQYKEANEQYEILLNHNQDAAFLWFESALSYESRSQPEQGLTNIQTAIELRPDNNVYQLAHARLLKLSNQITPAITVLDELLNKNPTYMRGLKLMAEYLSDVGDANKLIDTYKQILTINSTDYETMFRLSETLFSVDEYKKAQEILVTMLNEQSDNIEARYLLAMSYYNTKQFIDSLDEIESLLRLDKNNQQAIMLKNTITSMI